MLEVGLREAVSSQHPLNSPPATYNRNTNRSTIDGLFVSFGVEVTQAGMLAFDSDKAWRSDHRLLWIKIETDSVIPGKRSSTPTMHIADLQSSDPRQRKIYQRRCRVACQAEKIPTRLKALRLLGDRFLNGEKDLLPAITRSYEKLSDTLIRIRRQAVKGLRKKKAGGDPWSPTLWDYIARVDFWSRMVKKRLGVSTSWK